MHTDYTFIFLKIRRTIHRLHDKYVAEKRIMNQIKTLTVKDITIYNIS